MAAETPPLYQEVAERIDLLIQRGALRPGQRIPSIRSLSRELGVGMGTVKEAYWLLERRRLIEAHPQSGFYVLETPRAPPPDEAAPDAAGLDPQQVSLCRIYGAFQEQAALLRERGGSAPKPFLSLSMAEADIALLPTERLSRLLQEVSRDRAEEAFGYCMTPGHIELRRQLAVTAASHGLAGRPEDFIVTNGCHESLCLALGAACRPGDLVAVSSPVYFNLLSMLEDLHLKALEIPETADGMDLRVLAFALEHHPVKAILAIPNFNNPSSSLMPPEAKRELVALAARHEIPLIEDDIYGDLHFSGERPRNCAAWDTDGSVILCSSFSKTISPGLRCGWVRGGRWQAAIDRRKTSLNIGTSALTQLCLARYLAEGNYERHLRGLRAKLAEQADAARRAVIAAFPAGSAVNRPPGGLVLWVELPGQADSLALYQAALEAGVMVAPGALFSMKGRFNRHVRLNTGVWNAGTAEAVAVLGRLAHG
jgi:DNA-binding transcriptional MocR family regulator